ncbi:MAG: hypothetical protein QW273_01680 [Candidatus Pacearchaeota archaeon]
MFLLCRFDWTKNSRRNNKKSDLILAVGVGFHQFTLKNWSLNLKNSKIIRLDIDDKEITNNYPEVERIIGDIKITLKEIFSLLKNKNKRLVEF